MSAGLEPHLLEWMRQHSGAVVEPEYVEAFRPVLDGLPWAGAHLDWTRINGLDLPVEDVVARGGEARLFRHELACAWLGAGQHGVVAAVDDVVADLDLLFWKHPGHRYVCGADPLPQGGFELAFDDLAEHDGADRVRLRR